MKWTFPEGLGVLCHTCGNSGGVGWVGGGGGVISSLQKCGKSMVVLSEIPSVVGVWIFSGTTISRTMIQLIQKRGFPWHRFKVCLLKFDLIVKKVSK